MVGTLAAETLSGSVSEMDYKKFHQAVVLSYINSNGNVEKFGNEVINILDEFREKSNIPEDKKLSDEVVDELIYAIDDEMQIRDIPVTYDEYRTQIRAAIRKWCARINLIKRCSLQTKTILKCEICKEDVYMDIDDIWCACHIQKTIDCAVGNRPSFWYDIRQNERQGTICPRCKSVLNTEGYCLACGHPFPPRS